MKAFNLILLSVLVGCASVCASCSVWGEFDNPLDPNGVNYAGSAPYTVTFDCTGATTAASPSIKTVVYPATTLDTLPTPPETAGATFLGWFTATNTAGTPFTANTPVTANIRVYAGWGK